MRTLCVLLGIVSCVAWAVTAEPGAPVASAGTELSRPDAVPEESAYLLRETKRIRIDGDADDCATLHPVPLYEGAPSADAWEAFCRARFSSDATACAALPAMLLPDLRAACADASSRS